MADHNRKRALAEVVALDAWHEGFTAKRSAVDLHVDVVFSEGRIGGGADDPVRFRLALKRANVVVVIPPMEPAKVDKASVSRDAPQPKIKSTQSISSNGRVEAAAGLKIGASTKGIAGQIGAGAKACVTRKQKTGIEITEALHAIEVIQVQTADGDYAWALSPAVAHTLIGRPWDAGKQSRLRVSDTRQDRSKGIEPSIRVEVRCKREDLHISDISLKDGTFSLSKSPFRRNKLAAAEAFIRTKLFESGLISGDMSDPFAEMVISATIAESA